MSSQYPLAFPAPPPPDPPERPEGVSPWPPWPWWYAPVGFLVAFIGGGLLLALPVIAIGSLAGAGDDDPVLLLVATVLSDLALLGTAVFLASRVARPRLWHFGLVRTKLAPALGWAALGLFAFYIFAASFTALLGLDEEQTTLDDLGAEDSTVGLISAGILVVVIAPIVEEVFFRGFFYRSIRNRLSVLPAALISGAVFGLIHASTGVEAIPTLGVLGVIFCLVYERTKSLYPVIAMHAWNNTLAYGIGVENALVAVALGAPTIAACVLAPRFVGRRAPAL